MRCNSCKFWDAESDILLDGHTDLGLGRCQKVAVFWDSTRYVDDHLQEFKDEAKHLLAFVQDGTFGHAELYTKKDFFCAQFEAKQ